MIFLSILVFLKLNTEKKIGILSLRGLNMSESEPGPGRELHVFLHERSGRVVLCWESGVPLEDFFPGYEEAYFGQVVLGENQEPKIAFSDGEEHEIPSNGLRWATREFFGIRLIDFEPFCAQVKSEVGELLTMEGEPAPLYYCPHSSDQGEQAFHDETMSNSPVLHPGECPCCGGRHTPYKVGSYKTDPTDGKVTVTFWDNNPHEYQEVQVPFHGQWTEIPANVDAWFWRQGVHPEKLQEFLQEVFEISPEIELS